MGKIGCSIDGNLDVAKFSEPMPWIGIYIAAASLACAIAMGADVIHGVRRREFWFRSTYLSINATSLTIIAVAIKLSVDLNTPMPRRIDQLAKLSSSVLICTLMGNSMPSLGTMQNTEICVNIIALGILVVTVVVNICIQLATGVIYLYWKEHALIMFLMLVLLVILSFSALPVPTNKKYLEAKYKIKYEITMKEGSKETDGTTDEKLKGDLMKFWMMAYTSCPQFVVARSVTCTASGALCLLSAMTLTEVMLRSYLMPWSFEFCHGESDYKWSAILFLIAQSIAVGVGTIAPASRWFTAVNFRCPKRAKNRTKELKLGRYWTQCLVEMKECPLTTWIQHRRCRKLAHGTKNQILDLCIVMQTGIVLASEVIQCISIYFVSRVLLFCNCCKKLMKFKPTNCIFNESRSDSRTSTKLDLRRFVLHLEGEDELVELMIKNNIDATDHCMQRGKKKQPKHLIELLKKSITSGLQGVTEFDSDLVPSLDSEEPPNCWALPIVTLTAIAVALPNASDLLLKQLMHSVHEGLMYVKLIEDNLDAKEDLNNIRRAAYIVWLEVDLYYKWLDVDLRKLSLQAESTKEILEGLAETAKNRFADFKKTETNQCLREIPSRWPIKILAANSMYRICQTILKNYESRDNQMGERLFDAITVMISDIICACLTNLKQVIFLKCLRSTIEERQMSVWEAIFLLGKTEKILKFLEERALPNFGADQMASIDEWRSLHKLKNPLLIIPSSKNSAISFPSSDLYLAIE